MLKSFAFSQKLSKKKKKVLIKPFKITSYYFPSRENTVSVHFTNIQCVSGRSPMFQDTKMTLWLKNKEPQPMQKAAS